MDGEDEANHRVFRKEMNLIIIESPNKIKKLQSILSSDYKIVASLGHIFDLPRKDLGVDLLTFEMDLISDTNKKDILATIKKEADNADIIYIAGDADREGEALGKNIFDWLTKKNQKKCKRLLINAITKEAVEKALKNPTTIDDNLCDAQKGRRVTDRLVGYQISPVMWAKGLKGTSAGRVQSVALKYVADLEKKIMAFQSQEYWSGGIRCDGFAAELSGIDGGPPDIKTAADSAKIMADISKYLGTAKVTDYTKKTRTRSPEPPFITSTLQQVASNNFGWNAKKTMDVAQALFSNGMISYHRTDSVRIEPDKLDHMRATVAAKLGKNYVYHQVRTYANKDAAQDAHEAIRPTYEQPLNPLSPDESKLLDLVNRRFKASQMSDAQFDQAGVKIKIRSKTHTYAFKASGSIMTFDGFLAVYGESKENMTLPLMSVGSAIVVSSSFVTQHFTQPPGRFSDASLIKTLESEGVGRPSTYASIIETLINRGYAERDKKSVHATELGMMVSDYLTHSFPDLVDPEMTSKMEANLDLIAAGKAKYFDVISAFHTTLKAAIESARKIPAVDIFKTDRTCSECGSAMIKKVSAYGVMLGCSSYPKCGHIINIGVDGKETSGAEETGEACPGCGDGILKERQGKFSKFMACSCYPICKYTRNTDNTKPKQATEVSSLVCVKCGSSMLKRIGKDKNPWYGCCTFPKCKYTYTPREK